MTEQDKMLIWNKFKRIWDSEGLTKGYSFPRFVFDLMKNRFDLLTWEDGRSWTIHPDIAIHTHKKEFRGIVRERCQECIDPDYSDDVKCRYLQEMLDAWDMWCSGINIFEYEDHKQEK